MRLELNNGGLHLDDNVSNRGAERIIENPFVFPSSYVVSLEVDDDAGTATCRSYCMVLQASPPAVPLQPIWAGRYHDTFVRVDGEWRFRTRHFITDLVGDMTEHLNVDLSTL